jgi:hypothetical protein
MSYLISSKQIFRLHKELRNFPLGRCGVGRQAKTTIARDGQGHSPNSKRQYRADLVTPAPIKGL